MNKVKPGRCYHLFGDQLGTIVLALSGPRVEDKMFRVTALVIYKNDEFGHYGEGSIINPTVGVLTPMRLGKRWKGWMS